MEDNKVLLKRIGKLQNPTSVEEYKALGGFAAIEKAVLMEKEQVLCEMDDAMLRGRGGAAYPAGSKWRHLYGNPNFPKYIVCNADEGEPGTFKDKMLLSQDPLSVIEGMLIAGWLFGAEEGFIYIRGEYHALQQQFLQALANAEKAGYLGDNIMGRGFSYRINMISGAGAYVCGENSALLNSVEGKTGRPRIKPPHLADVGLFLQPTLVNNVESFACVPQIIERGGKGFLALGTEDGGGTKLVCLSGHIKNRGVYEVPLGTPLSEILYSEEYGGGISTGKPLGFIHFGGQSGPLGFPEQMENMIYSYQGLWDCGLAIGSGAIVVMDDSVNVVEYLENVMQFFIHESCGKCTPCRLGTARLQELMQRFVNRQVKDSDIAKLEDMLMHLANLSACGLGQSVPTSIRCALKYRRSAFEACLAEGS